MCGLVSKFLGTNGSVDLFRTTACPKHLSLVVHVDVLGILYPRGS